MALRAEVLQDDDRALHVRLYPTRKGLRLLGWLPWIAVAVYSVAVEPATVVFFAPWSWFIASDLAFGLAGWEEIVVTPWHVIVRQKALAERVLVDLPTASVVGVRLRERPFLTGRNDHRRLTIETRDGQEHPFAQKLDDPEGVARLVTDRLRS